MKVTIENFLGRELTMELSEALRPVHHNSDGGRLEQAQSQAEANAEAIGNLAARLVEKGVLTAEEALKACDSWSVLLEVGE